MLQTEISADARTIADKLAEVPVTQTISLAEISQVICRDVRACRHVLATARRLIERE